MSTVNFDPQDNTRVKGLITIIFFVCLFPLEQQNCTNNKQLGHNVFACLLTCGAEGPGDVEVKVVGSVDGHVQVLVGLETTKEHSRCFTLSSQCNPSGQTDVHVEPELPRRLASGRVGECGAVTSILPARGSS